MGQTQQVIETVKTRGLHDYVCRSYPFHIARVVGTRRTLDRAFHDFAMRCLPTDERVA